MSRIMAVQFLLSMVFRIHSISPTLVGLWEKGRHTPNSYNRSLFSLARAPHLLKYSSLARGGQSNPENKSDMCKNIVILQDIEESSYNG